MYDKSVRMERAKLLLEVVGLAQNVQRATQVNLGVMRTTILLEIVGLSQTV